MGGRAEVVARLCALSRDGAAPVSGRQNLLYKRAVREFGSWGAACAAAGLRTAQAVEAERKAAERRDRIIARLRALSKDGVAPSTRGRSRLNNSARRGFGSWRSACAAAGLKTAQDIAPQRRIVATSAERREKVIADLRALSRDGVAPGSGQHKALNAAARRLFGSWDAACAAAGLSTRQGRRRFAPSGCEEAERLLALAVGFSLRHGVHGPGGGEIVLRIMQAMRDEGI